MRSYIEKKNWGATVCEYMEDKEVWYGERLVQARRRLRQRGSRGERSCQSLGDFKRAAAL